MPVHPLKTTLRHFLAIYQKRKVFGMFWINPLTVPYSIEIQLSTYKFTFFPLIFIQLYNNGGFKIGIGLFTFFAEFVKLDIPENHDKIFNLFKEMIK